MRSMAHTLRVWVCVWLLVSGVQPLLTAIASGWPHMLKTAVLTVVIVPIMLHVIVLATMLHVIVPQLARIERH